MKTPQPKCPECEKLFAVSEKSNSIGTFLDWLKYSKKVTFAEWALGEDRQDALFRIEPLLAEYFNIDLDVVDKERSAFLKWLQEEQE